MNKPLGIGKLDRQRLAAILHKTKCTISISEAAEILQLTKQRAAKLMGRWALNGWLSRIKRGTYIPVPLESITTDIPLEDPYIIAERLYSPCYIGGWSAAEYWGLTEQIFRSVIVLTCRKLKSRQQQVKGTVYLLTKVSDAALFGLKGIWRENIKVSISDPTRTILDLLTHPSLGGGIQTTVEILENYLKSEHKDLALLVDYAKRLNNGAVFKRLGFLVERFAPEENEVIKLCLNNLTTGNVKLDLQLNADKLITRWRLWVPKNWKA